MFDKFLKKSIQIKFSVEGKPPKKTKPSLWSKDSKQTESVLKLRQKAYETSKEEGLNDHFHGPVKITLTIYDSNPIERLDRHDYSGDLDAFIGGIFDSLQPSPPDEINNLKIHPMFKEKNEIRHDIGLIIGDDAQFTTSVSRKRKNNKNEETHYTVLIEKDDDF